MTFEGLLAVGCGSDSAGGDVGSERLCSQARRTARHPPGKASGQKKVWADRVQSADWKWRRGDSLFSGSYSEIECPRRTKCRSNEHFRQ